MSCHISAYSGTSGSRLNAVFNGEQEKESIMCVSVAYKNLSFGITICHQSASLVMPKGDSRDRFFYPTHTLMKDFICYMTIH